MDGTKTATKPNPDASKPGSTTTTTKTDGPRITTTHTTTDGPKTTTYTTEKRTTSYDTDIFNYKPGVTGRSVVIQRTSYGGPSSQSRTSSQRSSYGPVGGLAAGAYALVTSTGVNAVKDTSNREKKDMQDLNERFASYIEKVRFLEAQNRKLADELDKLKSRWGKETTQIKAMYQAELDEARRLLDDAEKEKARLEIKCASLEELLGELRDRLEQANREVQDSREKIERQNQQLSDYESEISLLRRRMESFESDREKDKKQIAQLQDALNRARADLDNETLLHVDAENRRQTLEEELEFLKSIHEQELKELAALAYRDTTAENRDFWKSEMGNALREIQQVYDEKLDTMRIEMENTYSHKLNEFRTGATRQTMDTVHMKEESKRLRNQLTELRDKLADLDAKNNQLQRELDALRREKENRERELEQENEELKGDVAKTRAEMEAILKELQNIMDTKLGLELEIAAYRKLLEGEESRIGLKSVVDSYLTTSSDDFSLHGALDQMSASRGEMSAKTTYQRSAKGPISIQTCSADGKFITLENTGRKEECLGGWKLTRNVDGQEKIKLVMSDQLVMAPGAKINIWSKGNKPSSAPSTDFETEDVSFGIGSNIITKLFNQTGEDRATHGQKTVYS